MHPRRNRALACLTALLLAGAAPAEAQTTERVSVATGGAAGDDDSSSGDMSADGRFVAFRSDATNLVSGDTNGTFDVYRHDRLTGVTLRVSLGPLGAEPDDDCSAPSISGTGNLVAFTSSATNLVSGDTNGASDVFLRNVFLGTTSLLSEAVGGGPSDASSFNASISRDGRYVAFQSDATNLVAGDTNGLQDVFLFDTMTQTSELVSVASSGAQGSGGDCWSPHVTPDGRFVCYYSYKTDLVPGDTNGRADIFLRDRLLGTTERVSLTSSGGEASNHSFSPMATPDGRFVVFSSAAGNLVPGDINTLSDVFLRDRTLGVTERLSDSYNGALPNGPSSAPRLSDDARYVVFQSLASNLAPGDTNGGFDGFLRDRALGATEIISVSSGGVQSTASSGRDPGVTPCGRFIHFHGSDGGLVPGDTNGALDVFVRDRGGATVTAYCTAGTTSQGCVALISGSGTPSASATSGFDIQITGADGQRNGLLFYGIGGRLATTWGMGGMASSSFLCVKSPTQRTPAGTTTGTPGACDGAYVLDWNQYVSGHPSALGAPFAVGDTVNAQFWFRDPPSPNTTHLSDGLEFTLAP